MSRDKRVRVTISRYEWFNENCSDIDIITSINQRLLQENRISDSCPNLVSVEEIEYGTMRTRELEII